MKTTRALLKTADIPVAEVTARFGIARSTLYEAILSPAAKWISRLQGGLLA